MTINKIDCAKCGGTGFFLRAKRKLLYWYPRSFETDFEIEKRFCDCVRGKFQSDKE